MMQSYFIESPATFQGAADAADHRNATDLDSGPVPIAEAVDDPHRLARVVLARHRHPEGSRLVHYRGDFHVWRGTHFEAAPDFADTVLVQMVKEELDDQHRLAREAARRAVEVGPLSGAEAAGGRGRGREARPAPVQKVTKNLISNVRQALVSLASLDGGREAPFWLEHRPGDAEPTELIPARNALVDISGPEPLRLPHTPRLFSTYALGYAYDTEAPPPERFLAVLRGQLDEESIDCLLEQLGDMLSPDIRRHAIFVWIGPPRSGRSTMREVAEALIGKANVGATSAASLGNAFGLEPLYGRPVVFLGDARTGDMGESAVMMDRLLRITGGDPVDVNRKHRAILANVRMRTRLCLLSNELPNFRDASTAIVRRYNLIAWTRTIPPDERDPDLAATLMAELPGILNEAIRGLQRLRARTPSRFVQPTASVHLIEDADDLASPVRVFVRECYDVVGPDEDWVPTREVYQRWCEWAREHGHPAGNDGIFGKNLRAAFPHLRKGRPRNERGDQEAAYYGLARKPPAFL